MSFYERKYLKVLFTFKLLIKLDISLNIAYLLAPWFQASIYNPQIWHPNKQVGKF